MPALSNIKKDLKVGAALGVGALILNLMLSLLSFPPGLALGNICLFMSASALGIPGALVSLLVGAIPRALVTGEYADTLRVAFLCLCVAGASEKLPKLPSFTIVLGAWVCFLAPLSMFLKSLGGAPADWSAGTLVLGAYQEILLSMSAGALLLNSNIWASVSQRARIVSASSLLGHLISVVISVTMLVGISISNGFARYEAVRDFNGQLTTLALAMIASLLAPLLLGMRISRVLSRDAHELLGVGRTSPDASKSFSGLSSDYWRRQDLAKRARENNADNDKQAQNGSNGILSPDIGICALSRSGTISFLNRKFVELTGMTANDAIGKNIDSVGIPHELAKSLIATLDATFEKGARCTECRVNELPHALRFLEISSQRSDAFENSSMSDGPDSAILKIKDITERRTIEAHLLQAQKLNSLGSFVGGIAHAFNNALTSITGQASFARHICKESALQAPLSSIVEAAKSAGELVRKLLDFAEGKPALAKKEHLRELIDSRLDLLRKMIGEDYEIWFEKPAEDITVQCDSNLIFQALTNLVQNARDAYGQKHGPIFISLETEEIEKEIADVHIGARPGTFARLRVRDEGEGMNSEILSRAFDPLFTTRSGQGRTGLGLSTVFAIVRAHDGFLTAESRSEKGTIISLYLPVTQLSDQETIREKENVDTTRGRYAGHDRDTDFYGNQEKILVVEDEPRVRELIAAMLSTIGYEVASCGNGEEALKKCSDTHFDLLLVDLIMPKMGGIQLISKIRESQADTRTLVMTGYGVTNEMEEARIPVIPKPFDIDTLARAVKNSLRTEAATAAMAREDKGSARV